MTGPGHYLAAERMLSSARSPQGRGEEEMATLAAAQIHATLALAAATAMNDSSGGMGAYDYDAWREIVSVHSPRPVTP
ncbi:MAG TPA: hypothetical protein VIX86_24635 [Streptosporangiaceae bacterium]